MKNFFKNLWKKSKKNKDPSLLTFLIECTKCGEKIKVTINKKTDLMNQFNETGEAGCAYILKKEVLGNNCQNLMMLNVEFDRDYKIVNESAEKGRLLKDTE